MSNFFQHLLLRSLSPNAGTVQPRLASHFETGPLPAKFSEERRETILPSAISPQPSPNPAPPPPPPHSAIPPSPAPSPATGIQAALASNVFPSTSSPTPAAPLAPTAAAVSLLQHGPRETRFIPTPSIHTLLVEHVTEHTRETPAPSAQGLSPSVSHAGIPSSVPTLTPPSPAIASGPLSPSLVHPTTAPAPSAPAPSIHVTIGRVEIRAIHVPAAAPARAPQPARRPAVSLEHYLNQRDAK